MTKTMSTVSHRGGKNNRKDGPNRKIWLVLKEILNVSAYLLCILLATWFILNFVAIRARVDGSSMENTLSDGEGVIVERLSYRFGNPQRFDIIVFPFQYKKNTYYIKRIIGLPGEKVYIENGDIYINDVLLTESYGREVMREAGIAATPVLLGAGEYFVLGDNRNESSDSRDPSVGIIKKKDILGRAWLRIWPFDSIGILKHQ